ncbi:MAG: type III-A CRISPR-associated protein Csm2 [Saprospiraceae bacterium]|nr:type III-A CRISPR-associated protein Csm2 [Saprospiraceae bacterium]
MAKNHGHGGYPNRGAQHSKGEREKNKHQKILEENKANILNFRLASNLSDLIDALSAYVKAEWRDLSTHQLRNLYDEVRRKKTPNEIQLLRAKFAYAQARQSSKPQAKEAIKFLDLIMSDVKQPEQVDHFKAFFEAVVAYHKFHHPKS